MRRNFPPEALPQRFSRAMESYGFYEPNPVVAVGVSGGADSLALALLLADWLRQRSGRLVALIVDHRLRPGSKARARAALAALSQAGIAGLILTRRRPLMRGNLQAAARQARFDLFGRACFKLSIVHLALAHHRGDQAETFLLRLGRGRDPWGCLGMRDPSFRPRIRILRPLLATPPEQLRAYVQARGLCPIEDPSNADLSFARVRLRRLQPQLEAEGLTAARWHRMSAAIAEVRAMQERDVVDLLVAALCLHPLGWATLDLSVFLKARRQLSLLALARLLACVSGQAHAPRWSGVEGFYERLHDEHWLRRGFQLHRCWLVPRRGDRGKEAETSQSSCLLVRESRFLPPACRFWAARRLGEGQLGEGQLGEAQLGETLRWDGRFIFSAPRSCAARRRLSDLALAPLGGSGARQARLLWPRALAPLPLSGLRALPALWCGERLAAVPPLGLMPKDLTLSCFFSPERPLTTSF